MLVFLFSYRPVHQDVHSTLHPFIHQSTSPLACPPACLLYLQLFARSIICPKGAHFDFIGQITSRPELCKEREEDILTDVSWALEEWILPGFVEKSYPDLTFK